MESMNQSGTRRNRMLIVAIGWMYVVTLMAATAPSVFGGIMTFFGYGVLPLSIVYYLAGAGHRARRRAAARDAARHVSSGEEPPPT
jgi:hypothetical protein